MTLVVPGDVDAPTGGNVWDRRVRDELGDAGHDVAWRSLPGTWPRPTPADEDRLAEVLAGVPDGGAVLLDGLVACGAPDPVLAHAGRLRLVVVVHLPLADETGLAPDVAADLDAAERRVLAGVAAVVVTSAWAAARLAGRTGATPVVVAEPGTDPAPGDAAVDRALPAGGGHLLCLAAVTPRKGQRVLAAALARLDAATPWSARVVGPWRDPAESAALAADVASAPLAGRVDVTGPATGAALEAHWRWADLLVVPSLVETYGMVVTEALARGVPALVTTGSALPATLGRTGSGPPGLLVPPGDVPALAEALDRWLADPALRRDLAARARRRAVHLPRWPQTAETVAAALRPPHAPRSRRV